MAKKEIAPARTKLEEVNESLTNTAQKLEKNKKTIYWIVGIVMGIVVAGAGWYYLIHLPGKAQAASLIGKADLEYIQGDSANAAKDYKVALDKGADRAAYNLAIISYQAGKYKEAAAHLESYDAKGKLVGPAAMSLLGDCYVNLKDYDKAIGAFDKAIKLADGNELYAPTFMVKKATVLHAQKKYAYEAAIYQSIKDDYPSYARSANLNVDKYLERANALAGK